MKKHKKVRSKQIKAGATGVIYYTLRVSQYKFIFQEDIDKWGEEYKDSKVACFVEFEDKSIGVFPIEDLEEINE